MIGHIAVYWDGETYDQVSDPSVVHPTREAAIAEGIASRLSSFSGNADAWAVELPEPALPVPAPDGWAVVAEDDGQLSMVPAC